MTSEQFIVDADKVIARFGEWPHSHDMEVVSLHRERGGPGGPSVDFLVFAWTYTGRVTPEGHYEQTKHSLIRFRCERVKDNVFEGFNLQNVLDGLNFSPTVSSEGIHTVQVRLPSIYGIEGLLECEHDHRDVIQSLLTVFCVHRKSDRYSRRPASACAAFGIGR
ncbi:MAG TPA: Imm50 family immunity protein [Tepidisphaeraceae bacterium]|jgi:hypothetical protein